MAEGGTLLRCYTGNCIVGSNPTLSANKYNYMLLFELTEKVGGGHLYHYTNIEGAKGILSSGSIRASVGQVATTAQTKLPTVSVTRDWNYAIGKGENVGRAHDVIFILDRQKIEHNYKTIGTSQSSDVRAGAFSGMRSGKRDAIRSISPGGDEFRTIDTDNDRTISQAEREAFKQAAIDAGPEELEKAQTLWQRIHQFEPKHGKEYEEAIPVKSGVLPIKNIIVGFYLNSAEAQQDPELQDHSFNVTERL